MRVPFHLFAIIAVELSLLASCALDPPTNTPSRPSGPVTPAPPASNLTPEATSSLPSVYHLAPPDASETGLPTWLEGAQLFSVEGHPPAVLLQLTGSLPTPCYKLQVTVSAPDAHQAIHVTVAAPLDTRAVCTQVITPFEKQFPLGTLASGAYQVWVNDTQIGGFNLP